MHLSWEELTRHDVAADAANWRAQLSLDVHRKESRSVVDVRHRGPLRVQKPFYPEGNDIAHVVVVHPPGGIAGGDRLELSLCVNEDAALLATTPGATKWYRADGKPATQHISLNVARNATLEWLPQETIVYDGSLAHNLIDVRVASGGCALGCEVLCFGRRLSGERFRHGNFRQRLSISIDDELAWVDAFGIAGDDALFVSPIGLQQFPVAVLVWLAGVSVDDEAAERLREPLAEASGVWGLTVPHERVLVVRGLAPDTASAVSVARYWWSKTRPFALGRAAVAPRIWAT